MDFAGPGIELESDGIQIVLGEAIALYTTHSA